MNLDIESREIKPSSQLPACRPSISRASSFNPSVPSSPGIGNSVVLERLPILGVL